MPFDRLRRRELITLLGGAAATWPLAARAQQSDRIRRVGALMPLAADDPEGQARLRAFVQELRQLGWINGRNVQIDTRWGEGDADRYRRYAAELVALASEVILAGGGSSVGPLLQTTRSVPIVFTQTPDPVGAGFVESLARPGGKATGFTTAEFGMGAKWMELHKQIATGRHRPVLHPCLFRHGREMAGASQTDTARCDTGRNYSGPRHYRRNRRVRLYPVCSAVGGGGGGA